MTKEETVKFVEILWATWPNNDLTTTAKKVHYEAWHRIIQDLDYEDCLLALDEFIIEDKPWPPKGGAIRRRVIDKKDPDGVPPSAVEAWGMYQRSLSAATSGGNFTPLHPIIISTITRMGSSTERGLHTNADRNVFIATYEERLREYEVKRYVP